MSKAVIEIEEVNGDLRVSIKFGGRINLESAAHQTAVEMVCEHAAGQGVTQEELLAQMNAAVKVVRH